MRYFLLLALTTLSLFASAQEVGRFNLYFDSDQHELLAQHKDLIDDEVAALVNIPAAYSLEIIGHTDNDGNMEYNKVLSKRRAKSIASYFGNQGFPRMNMDLEARSFTDSVASNNDESGKGLNRRVEVVIKANSYNASASISYKNKMKSYSVNVSQETEIETETGTIITIPENAFVDASGNIIKGEVTVNYREFQDPIDFMTSGIPMTFNDNGEFAFYNSAGMFEITAEHKGKSVDLQEGKQVEVAMEMSQQLNNLNFYEYSPEKQGWNTNAQLTNNQGIRTAVAGWSKRDGAKKPGLAFKQRWGPNYVWTNRITKGYVTVVETGLNLIKDSTSLLARYEDDNRYPSTKNRLEITKRRLDSKLRSIAVSQKRMNRVYKMVEISYSKKKAVFSIDCKTRKHGETDVFVTTNFHYDHEKNGKFDKNWFELKWDSCIVDYNETTDLFNIDLFNDSTEISVEVSAYHTRPSLKRRAFKQESLRLIAAYYAVLADRSAHLERLRNDKIKAEEKLVALDLEFTYLDTITNRRGVAELEGFQYYAAHLTTSNGEFDMELEEWCKYFDENPKMFTNRFARAKMDKRWDQYKVRVAYNDSMELVRQQMQTAIAKNRGRMLSAATRTLKIDNMGIFNADQVCRMTNPMLVHAQYKNTKGQEVKVVSIFLIDSKVNGLIEYNGFMGYSPYRFALRKSSRNSLFAMDIDGNMYKISKEEFAKYGIERQPGNETSVEFTLSPVSKAAKKEDLMAATGQ